MTSPQVSANNAHNVLYALRPSTTLTQYQGVQTLTATGMCILHLYVCVQFLGLFLFRGE